MPVSATVAYVPSSAELARLAASLPEELPPPPRPRAPAPRRVRLAAPLGALLVVALLPAAALALESATEPDSVPVAAPSATENGFASLTRALDDRAQPDTALTLTSELESRVGWAVSRSRAQSAAELERARAAAEAVAAARARAEADRLAREAAVRAEAKALAEKALAAKAAAAQAEAARALAQTNAAAAAAGAHWRSLPAPPPAQMEALIRQIWPDELEDKAVAVAMCESTLNPNAVGLGGHYLGLFQFSDYGTLQGLGGTRELAFDPEWNVSAALRLYNQRGWQPWECA